MSSVSYEVIKHFVGVARVVGSTEVATAFGQKVVSLLEGPPRTRGPAQWEAGQEFEYLRPVVYDT